MSNVVQHLASKGLLRGLPNHAISNIQYMVRGGSYMYGSNNKDTDWDVVGVYIPSREETFPQERGYLHGFDEPLPVMKPIQAHHVVDKEAGKEYDITLYPIQKFFALARDGNPNIIDILYAPQDAVLVCTALGEMIVANRNMFVALSLVASYSNYAESQLHKMRNIDNRAFYESMQVLRAFEDANGVPRETPRESASQYGIEYERLYDAMLQRSRRSESIKRFGFDTKFAFNLIRLSAQLLSLIETGNMNLRQQSDTLKAIRAGRWSLERLEQHFYDLNRRIHAAVLSSAMQAKPNSGQVKDVLSGILERHYQDFAQQVHLHDEGKAALKEIADTLRRYGY